MILVDQLTKRYGRYTAVDSISFSVRPGTVTGFLGPNGAGKSTTMRVMVGLTRHRGPAPRWEYRTQTCPTPASRSASSSTPRPSTPAAPGARCSPSPP